MRHVTAGRMSALSSQSRARRGRAVFWAASLVVLVVTIALLVPASSALASGKSDVASVWKSISRLIQTNTAESTASPTLANETFTLFQGLSGSSTLAPTVIVDVQPYACELTADQIATLHSENPNTKVIRYVDTVEAIDTVSSLTDPQPWSLDYARRLNTDAEWQDIWANHQSWFLKDSQGQYIHRPSGSAFEMNPLRASLMDPGNAGWRDWLVAKVSQRLNAGYDGVFLDLCSPTPSGYTAIPAKYSGNYGSWRNDINGLIDYIKGKFPNAEIITNSIWQGCKYYANASPNPIDDNAEDGTEVEGFIYGNGSGPTESVSNWLQEVQIVGKLGGEGKAVLARTGLSGTDSHSPKQLLAYSVATFLLGKNSSSSYFSFCSFKSEPGFDIDYLASVYDLPLGDATGAYYQKGVAYRRDFTNGKVIVNPDDSTQAYTFIPLAANHYADQDGNLYDSAHPLTLQPKSGVILIAIVVPSVILVTPAKGSTLGGDSVVITGQSLTGATKVTFGGTQAADFSVDSPTQITATTPVHAAGTVHVQVTTTAGTSANTANDDFTYAVAAATTRVEAPTTSTGGFYYSGTWASFTSASASGGSYMRSSTSGAYVIIAFKGTQLDWITMKGTTGGMADIYVDGSSTKAASINLYVSSPVYQQNLWSTGPLPDGYHTVKILRDASSPSGRYVTIDAVEVAGTLGSTRIEDNASPTPFTWNPVSTSWTTGTTTSASGGTYKYINISGAYLSFKFTGVGFNIIAKTAPSYGNLTVTIDGVSQTVSLYSSATTYKKIVLTKFVAPGTHTVKISRAGTKSSSSTAYTIDLDAIDLFGTMG